MNMQALMRQAQAMQKDITKAKEEVENQEFIGESSLVRVKVNGKKEVLEVIINTDDLDNVEKDDIAILSDMILVAINKALAEVDKAMESKMGKYSNMMSGLF